jgi:glycosyltransferase involved in cell wall biosynthesis
MQPYPKAVVVLAGARDHYQLPLALHEGGLLQVMVTDMYWPADTQWFSSTVGGLLGRSLVSARSCAGLPSSRVEVSKRAMAAFFGMKLVPILKLNRAKDRALGRRARQLALNSGAALVSYNYYGIEAFKGEGQRVAHRILFQIQAHPKTQRELLLEELERTPRARSSLRAEYELSLSEQQFQELCEEPQLANGWIATSSFAADTLAAHGAPRDRIRVVPYGVDSATYTKRERPPDYNATFNVAFVGSLIQRKGISYLLDAVRLMKPPRKVQLTLYTRGQLDKELMAGYGDLNMRIKEGFSGTRLANELHSADVFVLPSLAEGFGLVILEAMACGVPVIATNNTGAADLIDQGAQGFLIPIRSTEAIAERLIWGMDHRDELAAMGEAAAARARLFTWERFKVGIREAYYQMVAPIS